MSPCREAVVSVCELPVYQNKSKLVRVQRTCALLGTASTAAIRYRSAPPENRKLDSQTTLRRLRTDGNRSLIARRKRSPTMVVAPRMTFKEFKQYAYQCIYTHILETPCSLSRALHFPEIPRCHPGIFGFRSKSDDSKPRNTGFELALMACFILVEDV